ncbi:MAG: glycosyltransferase family 9 protein [Flavobacteriales bacterium]|nr:glycosyltransferase family 9 protein [Flavobacteriales bacterium]MCB9449412.1 glycosyltransferase family 9 protein [Flavobacteriales bacterium]
MKILVIRFSSIGDVVLTTPVLRAVKEQVPGAEIHFACKRKFSELLVHNPHVDRFFLFDESITEILVLLVAQHYDVVIDLQHSLRSARLKKALKRRSYTFPKMNVRKWILVNFKKNLMPDMHVVDRYLMTTSRLGVKKDGKGLDVYLEPKADDVLQRLPPSMQSGYIGLVIGAQHATKCLPEERLVELCRMLPYPIVLMGGTAEKERGARMVKVLGPHVHDTCGTLSLTESATLVKHAKVLITHDTGMMHVGAAFQKDMVVFWGNTVPAFGMYPYYGSKTTARWMSAEVADLSCRPCSKIGFDSCPKKHFRCMNDQQFEPVVDFVRDTWESRSR